MGDNIDIVAVGNKLFPVWMDNSTGEYQIWTVPIELIPVSVDEPEVTLSEFKLEQNYPNPFNPVTKIKFSVPSVETGHAPSLHVTLKIYDLLGNELYTLVNEAKTAGQYEVEFNAENFSSGIYFYRIAIHSDRKKAGSHLQTKKMIYLK
ncbi:MAG: T9SS type A sorting domain-containing protein [Ignavibacteriales bacterium]|nr:MAG: T9SS type A sorting domain-containing protein [Ignavibacteriales bacterium]